MADYDLVVRGGTVVTGSDTMRADVGIRDGRIAALGERLEGAATLDAGGLLVLPGGVDTHCHIEQLQEGGGADEETWETASRSCLAGGTTSVISFSTQFKGHGILAPLAEYQRRAQQAMVDYSFHQIITDATDDVIWKEIPQVVAQGVRSLKVFLTYDPLHLDDRAYLRVLAAARREGALVTVHCENYEAINWRTEALLAAGMTAPKYHAWARPRMIEREATHRAIALAEMVDQPIQVFHVSCSEVAGEIARARALGLKVWGETCPQYFVLTAEDMDRPGFEGAKFMCSPAPRSLADQELLWQEVRRGTLDVVSSDHSGWTFGGARGKRVNGVDAPFRDIPNGVPGLAARLAILFSEGVVKGRIDVNAFVRITATNPARLFGLYPRKGSVAPGFDADLVLWDPAKRVTLTNGLMQSVMDYTPYEGLEVTGWPVATLLRGRVAMRDGVVQAEPGQGRFLARGPYEMIRPRGVLPDGFDASAFA
ncbi:MAG: dihydropyrimidinase [Acetobacteraceae bacterium]|nr:dihydropyrimidinase [Acetobacteraceae bacterium]